MVTKLRSPSGLQLETCSFGAAVTRLLVPDDLGRSRDVVLGLAEPSAYQHNPDYFGCVVGRTAGRVFPRHTAIEGIPVTLLPNTSDGGHLHGGPEGWHTATWEQHPPSIGFDRCTTWQLRCPDGQSGYPGNIVARTRYGLTENHGWRIDYAISTDQPTLVAPTQHTYFNLAGHDSGSIDNHVLRIDASLLLSEGSHQNPTGKTDTVTDTPFDFRQATLLRRRLESLPEGIDRTYLIEPTPRRGHLTLAAEVMSPLSGIRMEVWTDLPALVVYTANHLDGSRLGKHGVAYARHAGLCLETQDLPIELHPPHRPASIVYPTKTYRGTTEYRFRLT